MNETEVLIRELKGYLVQGLFDHDKIDSILASYDFEKLKKILIFLKKLPMEIQNNLSVMSEIQMLIFSDDLNNYAIELDANSLTFTKALKTNSLDTDVFSKIGIASGNVIIETQESRTERKAEHNPRYSSWDASRRLFHGLPSGEPAYIYEDSAYINYYSASFIHPTANGFQQDEKTIKSSNHLRPGWDNGTHITASSSVYQIGDDAIGICMENQTSRVFTPDFLEVEQLTETLGRTEFNTSSTKRRLGDTKSTIFIAVNETGVLKIAESLRDMEMIALKDYPVNAEDYQRYLSAEITAIELLELSKSHKAKAMA